MNKKTPEKSRGMLSGRTAVVYQSILGNPLLFLRAEHSGYRGKYDIVTFLSYYVRRELFRVQKFDPRHFFMSNL